MGRLSPTSSLPAPSRTKAAPTHAPESARRRWHTGWRPSLQLSKVDFWTLDTRCVELPPPLKRHVAQVSARASRTGMPRRRLPRRGARPSPGARTSRGAWTHGRRGGAARVVRSRPWHASRKQPRGRPRAPRRRCAHPPSRCQITESWPPRSHLAISEATTERLSHGRGGVSTTRQRVHSHALPASLQPNDGALGGSRDV